MYINFYKLTKTNDYLLFQSRSGLMSKQLKPN